MPKEIDFDSQFSMSYEDYLKGIDIRNWYRYYFILKEVIGFESKNVLEIGAGNEIVKNCLNRFIENYKVMDINSKLNPDILSDLREFKPELKEKFDCVICTEVLEHMPYEDLEKNLSNIFCYLNKNGKALIAIPHRENRVAILNLFSHQEPLMITIPNWLHTPKGYYLRFFKKERKTKDPHHCWEIGMDNVERKNVEDVIKKVGFHIDKFRKLLYADFWVLRK